MTKKKKPARSETYGVTWFAEPEKPQNVLSAEADWSNYPVLWNSDESVGTMAIPIHDESCKDIARLLLKIGVEISAVAIQAGHVEMQRDLSEAKRHVLGLTKELWPYFMLRSNGTEKHLKSILSGFPQAHEYILSRGFDIFFHLIETDIVLFFMYGNFWSGIALTTPNPNWQALLQEWQIPYIGCPAKFQHLCWP